MFKLGVDIDGSINNFSELIYKCAAIYNESQGISKIPDLSDYNMERYFNWTNFQSNEFWSRFYKYALNSTVLLPEAEKSLSLLKHRGVSIYFITARLNKYRDNTLNWLMKYNIAMDSLIMDKDKSRICIQNEIDLMVEDEPENCILIARQTPVLCMAYPYNQHLEGYDNIKRINNWSEAYNEIIGYVTTREECKQKDGKTLIIS